MSATTQVQRRTVRYAVLEDILHDAESLAKSEVQTLGKWSFSEILEHLTSTMNSFFDGFGFKAPWFARTFIAPLVKNNILTKPMSAGFKLPESGRVLMPKGELSVDEALGKLRSAIDRFHHEMPSQPHPFFGRLTREEVVALSLRHAELHMSFVVPR